MAVRPVPRDDRRGDDLGPRRLRHEGRPRRGRRRRAPRRRARSDRRLDQLPRHRRRRGAGGQRHREAAGMGARQGRGLRSLHPGRADQPRKSRRHHEERTTRLADRPPDADRPAGPCRLSPSRAQPDPRPGAGADRAAGAAARFGNPFVRAIQSRSRQRRRRQRGGQCHSGRPAAGVQRAVQRSVVAADARRRNRTAPRRRRRRRVLRGQIRCRPTRSLF